MLHPANSSITANIATAIAIPKLASLHETTETGAAFLDHILEIFNSNAAPVNEAMNRLCAGLHSLRSPMPVETWGDFRKLAAAHPLREIMHQDPFTKRSFTKPRGYDGDAKLLDFMYREPLMAWHIANATELGKKINTHTINFAGAAAIRERRAILARYVDEAAAKTEGAKILSIASGHLREIKLSEAAKNSRVGKWYAADHDAKSVAHVSESYSFAFLQPLLLPVKDILAQKYRFEPLDLIYTAGLYDYLPQEVAKKFTQVVFSMLAPGGTFLFGNFRHDIPDIGFMETFMDLKLVLRSENEMADILSAIPAEEVSATKIFTGENGNMLYAQISKK